MKLKHLIAIAERPDLSGPEKGMMLVLFSFQKRGQCRPTHAQIEERYGCSRDTANKIVNSLISAGAINSYNFTDQKGHLRRMFVLLPPCPNFGKKDQAESAPYT